jgi:hypothetical protein
MDMLISDRDEGIFLMHPELWELKYAEVLHWLEQHGEIAEPTFADPKKH